MTGFAIFVDPPHSTGVTFEKERIAYSRWVPVSKRLGDNRLRSYFEVVLREAFCFTMSFFGGFQRWCLRSTRDSAIVTPSLSRSFLCKEAYGSRKRIFPRSPTTRCQGMPLPEGVAAIARPALRAPPGSCRALASAP